MLLFAVLCLMLGCGAVLEKVRHDRCLRCIPLRIHVNGTRGKSTTTRLIAAGLRAGGVRVIAKTTGTAPRLILEDGPEVAIRRSGKPNIIEQVRMVALAHRHQAEALVFECMALNPENQWVSEHRMLHSTIGVITNIRADHLDHMGPTLRDVASTLCLTIPRRGHLVTAERDYLSELRRRAESLQTIVHTVDPASISDEINEAFPYLSFKENVACALKVCELAGVERSVALRGMLAARPDPGVAVVRELLYGGREYVVLNACAANDYVSTLAVWRRFRDEEPLLGRPVFAVMNNRTDRSLRVAELAALLTAEIRPDRVILVGQAARLAKRELMRRGFAEDKIHNFTFRSQADDIFAYLGSIEPSGAIVFLLGNSKGFGEELMGWIERNVRPARQDLIG